MKYNGKHVVGENCDEAGKVPNSVLAFMVNPSLGAPSFVCRLIPVHSLKADFLLEQFLLLLQIIHECSGIVFLFMSDNLSVNQKLFRLLHTRFGSRGIFAVQHPIQNPVFPMLYLLYDMVHLLKNI